MKLAILITIFAISVVAGKKFLREKPDYLNPCKVSDPNFSSCFSKNMEVMFVEWKDADYLNPCKVSDPNFSSCFSKNMEVMFVEWKDGAPGLKSAGSIDPLHVKSISLSQPASNAIVINVQLKDIAINGLSGSAVKQASFDPKKFGVQLQLFVPKMVLHSDYVMHGQILNLALDGNGKSSVTIENIKLTIAMRLKVRKEGGLTFTDVDKLRLAIQEVSGMQLQLDNLFNGDKALEDSTNAVLNASWETLFQILRPGLSEAFGTVIKDRLGKIFAYVPAAYMLDDLPNVD